ncbi:hypothetical protein ACTFIV_001279 [Dictyostelium citrinum]
MADCVTIEQLQKLSVQCNKDIENKENNINSDNINLLDTTKTSLSTSIEKEQQQQQQTTVSNTMNPTTTSTSATEPPKKRKIFAKIHLLNRDGSVKNYFEMKKSKVIIGSDSELADIQVARPGIYPKHVEIIYDKEKKKFYLNPLIDPKDSDNVRLNFVPFLHKKEILGNGDIITIGFRSIKIEFIARVTIDQLIQPEKQYIPSASSIITNLSTTTTSTSSSSTASIIKNDNTSTKKPESTVPSTTNTTNTSSSAATKKSSSVVSESKPATKTNAKETPKPTTTVAKSTPKPTVKASTTPTTAVKKSINDDDYEKDYEEDEEDNDDNEEEEEEEEQEEEEKQEEKPKPQIKKETKISKPNDDDMSCKKGIKSKNNEEIRRNLASNIGGINSKILGKNDSIRNLMPISNRRPTAPITPTKPTSTSKKATAAEKPLKAPKEPKVPKVPKVPKKTTPKISTSAIVTMNTESGEEEFVKLISFNRAKEIIREFESHEKLFSKYDGSNVSNEKKKILNCFEVLNQIKWRFSNDTPDISRPLSSYFCNIPTIKQFDSELLRTYYSMILEPMSINLILSSVIYTKDYGIDNCLDDFNKVLENAKTYNTENSIVYWLAHYCKIELYKALSDSAVIQNKLYSDIKKDSEAFLKSIGAQLKADGISLPQILGQVSKNKEQTVPQEEDEEEEEEEEEDNEEEDDDEGEEEEEENEEEEDEEEEEDDENEDVEIEDNERDQQFDEDDE